MGRRAVYTLVILFAVLASVLAAATRRDQSHANDFIVLFPIELVAVLLGGAVAGGALAGRRDRAAGTLGVGLYVLVVAASVGSAFPIWLPSDNTILGSALLAGLLAAVGAGLSLAGAAGLSGIWRPGMAAACLVAGVLAFLAVTAGGMVYPLARLRLPIVVAALIVLAVLPAIWRRPSVARPLALAAVGAAVTIATLIVRGPGDWASGSASVKLYSFPIVVMAFAFSPLILDLDQPPRSPRSPSA